MLQKEYISLIKTLSNLTSTDNLNWNRGDSYYSYFVYTGQKEKILIDKYFSMVDDKNGACINMTIFDKNEDIINEIVSCVLADKESFELLETLYKIVDNQVKNVDSEKLSPIINNITESLKSAAQ